MNKKLYCFAAILAAAACGCGDDAGTSGKVVETCAAADGPKCSTEGARLVCADGIYEPLPCESFEGCKAGNCVRKCDIETYPTGCDGNNRLYCGSDGFVASEPCGAGKICESGACLRDSGADAKVGDPCDEAVFVGRCDGLNAELKCENGVVASSECESGTSCANRTCEKTTVGEDCNDADFATRCEGSLNQIVCKDGVQTREACEAGMICSNGVCSSACAGDLKMCDNGGNALTCENNIIKSTPCPELQTCVGGTCAIACEASYKGCSPDAASRMYCSGGVVKTEPCNEGFMCNRGTGACDTERIDSDCTPESLPAQCNKDGLVVSCEDGKVSALPCPAGQTCYLGECHDSAPCGEASYTPNCYNENSRKVCKDGAEAIEACGAGKICEGGICQTISPTPECADGSGVCAAPKIAKKCENGAWHQYYCKADSEVCNSGKCTSDIGSLESCGADYAPRCDGNKRMICENGYVSEYACEAGQHCESGNCYDDVNIGDPCDMTTFARQCDENGRLLVCHDSKIEAQSCGEFVCAAGECVACTAGNYAAKCADNYNILVCADGKLTNDPCPAGQHCESGICADNPQPGDPCDESSFHAYCNLGGKLIACEGSVVAEKTCGAGKPYCLNDACAECNPADGTQCIAGEDGAAATMTTCNADGTKTSTSCNADQTMCFDNACASCDPNAYVKSCPDETKARVCSDKGQIVDVTCNPNEVCENGACRKACAGDDDCDAHYICDTDKKCTFVPECTDIGKIECGEKDGVPVIRKCAGLGIWETAETCNASEECGKADNSETLMCRGKECEGTGLNMCSGNTPAKCENGKLVKTGAACAGTSPECVDGACKPCKYGSSADLCRPGSDGASIWHHCLENNTYEQKLCDASQNCIVGKGCESKCGESFANSCKPAATAGDISRTRVMCEAQTDGTGKIAEKECAYNEVCDGGECKLRAGATCNAYTFDNACVLDSAGNVYLESCGDGGIAYDPCGNSATDSTFCGTIDGKAGCYAKCDSLDSTYCHHGATGVGKVGPCKNGTTYDGKTQAGIVESASLCDSNGIAFSCFASPAEASKVLFNHYSCTVLNGAANSCDPLTGTCKNFKATASCVGLDAKCDGNKAVTCTIDPANITATNANGYVQVEETCSDIGANAKCATFEVYGVKMARCAHEQSLKMTGETAARTFSTLGMCKDADSLETIYKYKESSGSESWAIYTTGCQAGCVTKTSAAQGYDGTMYNYAYCE